jgi:ribosomal protein S18 acetylase RimI-like enzyme
MMSVVTTLRRATSTDASLMARVAQHAYAPYLERMNGQRPGPMDANYDALVAEAEAWVAQVEAEVVGFLILVAESNGLLVDNVAVVPSHQGSGVGRLLLSLAEAQAGAAGCDRIRLYTHETMVENQRLYERNGYVETHRDDEQGFGRVFYLKTLSG